MDSGSLGKGLAYTIDRFLTGEECDEWIARSEALGYEEGAPVTTADGPVSMPDVRNNARVIVDRPAWAAELWERLHPHRPVFTGAEATGLNERLRFYRYDAGERFAPHHDGYYQRPDASERSLYTFMVYLNEGFTGGETALLEIGQTVAPRRGTALVFFHDQLHAGVEVTEGRKYVLRTDIMFARDPPEPWPSG